MYKKLSALFLTIIVLLLLLAGCMPGDVTDDLYVENVYPNSDNTAYLGSNATAFKEAHINTLYTSNNTIYIGGIPLVISGNGTAGPAGPKGDPGSPGDKGDTGDTGPPGSSGNMTAMTLAELNNYITDATLDDSSNPRPPSYHGNEAHSSAFALVTDIAVNANLSAAAQDAINDSHSHTNNITLNAITAAFTTQLKSSYDWLVTNITATWKSSVDSFMTSTINGHAVSSNYSVTKTDMGLSSVPNLDTTNAVNNQHTHSNKTTLDNIQEALTTALKSTYDTCTTAFTSAYKTTLDNFMASKGAPSGLAPLDTNSKVPTANLGGAGASGTNYLRGDQTWAAPGGGSDPWTYLTITSTDFTTTSATAVDVTGLGFAPSANTRYEFQALLMIRTATATVNPRIGLAWATGLTDGIAMIEESQAAATVPIVVNGNINAVLLIAVGGLPSTTQSWPVRVEGMVCAGATPSGNVRIQLASETAGTTVRVVIGSFLRYRSY